MCRNREVVDQVGRASEKEKRIIVTATLFMSDTAKLDGKP